MPDFMGLKLSGAPEKEPARFPGAEISAVVAVTEASVRSVTFIAEVLIQAPASQAVNPAKVFWLLLVLPAFRLMLMTPWADKGESANKVVEMRTEQIPSSALFVMELFLSLSLTPGPRWMRGPLPRFDLE